MKRTLQTLTGSQLDPKSYRSAVSSARDVARYPEGHSLRGQAFGECRDALFSFGRDRSEAAKLANRLIAECQGLLDAGVDPLDSIDAD
jgi:hypothetical protein